MGPRLAPADRLAWSELDDHALVEQLRCQRLGLTADEYRRVVALIGREPTAVEVRIFDTMWSEHCSYKSSRRVLGRFPTRGREVVLGPGEDAGVVQLGTHAGRRYVAVLAHESHNHPSQVMPVEGAATGIGGIVRDVFCMGAEVVGVLDALRFGDPYGPHAARVRNIAGGVVRGIMEYANALGVPNLGGDVFFHPTFDDNCLVNVVAVGVCAESRLLRSRVPATAAGEPYDVILVGKPTDATGFGGAAFASAVLDSGGAGGQKEAVQVPDPFLKRVLFEATTVVFDLVAERGVEIGFKDLGAGGIACATSELAAAAGMGVDIDLDRVPVDRVGHAPEVIACAETQERFALVVPARLSEAILRIYNVEFELPALYPGAGARVIGHVVDRDRYVLRHCGQLVCDLGASVVTAGISVERAQAPRRSPAAASEIVEFEPAAMLETLLASPNGASRAPIYRGYDTEVRGRAVVRPGEGDAGVIAPVAEAPFGLALSVGGIPAYGLVDPYLAGAHAAYEAMRNVVAVGAEPVALTDCLNFGNPEDPEVFSAFVAAVDGIADAARAIGRYDEAAEPVPVVSGNVSFYNESTSGRAIAPSPIVACAGRLASLADATTMRLEDADSVLIVVGERSPELGGSELVAAAASHGATGTEGGPLPPIDFRRERLHLYRVLELIRAGWVRSCHDISSGGLLVAVVEMALGESSAPSLGLDLDLERLVAEVHARSGSARMATAAVLFGEAPGFVLEIARRDLEAAVSRLEARGVAWWSIGRVVATPRLLVRGIDQPIDVDLASLGARRETGLVNALA